MLNEHASAAQDFPLKRQPPPEPYTPDPFSDLRNHVAAVMDIVDEYTPKDDIPDDAVMMIPYERHLRVFEGRVRGDTEAAYSQLDALLAPQDQFALFRACTDSPQGAPHAVHIVTGRVSPVKGRPWLNLLLFVLTAFSVLFAGASYGIAGLEPELQRQAIQEVVVNGQVLTVIPRLSEIWRGFPYALSLLLILGAHELGHYFAARRHGHSVSLPYFIPLPLIGLGTMGAVIRSREPMRNRKVLIDIGAAGPLAGMVFAIPILIIGLLTSNVELITSGGFREGNSLLYALLKVMALGQFYPTATQDVVINQMAFAGWLGLFVTALNLIPVGQLDGGHVLYSLFGRAARRIYYPVLVGMVVLALFSQMWLIWVIILMLIGRLYAPPLDDITPLDPRRRVLALFTLAIFVLVFVPVPFTRVDLDGEAAPEATLQQQSAPPAGVALTLGD